MSDADPHCPECGEPIGQTATYCMHCSADLTSERESADANDDGAWDDSTGGEESGGWGGSGGETSEEVPEVSYGPTEGGGESATSTGGSDEQMLDPDGFVDNSLTVLVGIVGGIVVGIVGSIVVLIVTGSALGFLVGIAGWLGSTAYLVRQRTVQGAVAKSGYAVAVVLLLIPFVAFSPLTDVDGGVTGRITFFLASLLAVAFPAGFAAALGWVAAQFVPEDAGETPA